MNVKQRFKRFANRLIAKAWRASRGYEAASPSNYHARKKEHRSGDGSLTLVGASLRAIARHLDENHDLAIGILDDATNKVIGRGLTIVPAVMTPAGEPADRFNDAWLELWLDWLAAMPDVTRELTFGQLQRLAFRTLSRDGEVLVNHIEGRGRINHPTAVPYSIEVLEPDFLPFDMTTLPTSRVGNNRIVHGVEKNGFRQPVAYHLYLEHPGDTGFFTPRITLETKRVPAAQLTHLKLTKRLGQTRGVTVFHGVLTRLEDIKEYDDSERIAARVAAAFTAYIKRAVDLQGHVDVNSNNKLLEMAPGMIFADLLPGEEVGTIASDRPNAQYKPFVDQNIRRVAAGTGNNFSSVAKEYAGQFSSLRQEKADQEGVYGSARDYFVAKFMNEIANRFTTNAIAAGLLPMRGIDVNTLFRREVIAPAEPWIDPLKEVQADALAIEKKIVSRQYVQRKRGYDPRVMDKQIENDPFKVEPPAMAVEDDDADDETDNVTNEGEANAA